MTAAIVFLASAALMVYVLFGYPILLAFLSRTPRPVRKQPQRLTVSVLLPVRNGERWIRQKIESILALDYPRDLIDILVVSDGSTDATADIAEEFAAMARIHVLRLPPGGKAVALNAALQHATGDILFFTDVRQRLAADSLNHLVASLADPEVGVVSGELVILEGETHEEASVGLYWKYEKLIRRRLSAIDSILGATGSIYAMRRELAVPLPRGTLLDDVHQPLAAFFRGYRVILDDEAKAYDYPTSLDSEFRRKVRTQAGMYQIMRHYPALLGPANRMWIHFISHKVGRLLMPFALLAALVSAFWLRGLWAPVAVLSQIGFYSIALLDPWIPDGVSAKRLSSPVRTFSVLMMAAFCAPFAAMSSPERLWTQTKVSAPTGPDPRTAKEREF